MTKVIGITGKGGTGKTTFAALLIMELAKKGTVLAVDADPNYNLNQLLGVDVVSTIGRSRDKVLENVPDGMSKPDFMKLELERCLVEGDGFDLIAMGRPEGPGCYCYPNALIREYVAMLQKSYDFVVIDNEAGLEHLSRRTTPSLDVVFVLSHPMQRDITTAKRIMALMKEMNINAGRTMLVMNMANAADGTDWIEVAGAVPEDPELASLDEKGLALTQLPGDSMATKVVHAIAMKAGLV